VQGSPNRFSDNRAPQAGYPNQFKPNHYQYEGPNLVKSQLVPEQVGAGDYHYSTNTGTGPTTTSYSNQPINTFIPGHTTTTYTGHVGTAQSTSLAPGTYTTGTYVAKPFPSGNISTGISALNPSSYYTTSASGTSAPYQFYQPTTIVTSNLPTSIISNTGIPTRPYEIPTSNAPQGASLSSYTSSLPPISGYQSSTATTTTLGNPITFSSGQQIYSGMTGISPSTNPYSGVATYNNSYYPTSATETFSSRPQPYVYTNFNQQSFDSNTTGVPNSEGLKSGQTSSAARLGTISTSGIGSGNPQ
jgi:hypothetical protein